MFLSRAILLAFLFLVCQNIWAVTVEKVDFQLTPQAVEGLRTSILHKIFDYRRTLDNSHYLAMFSLPTDTDSQFDDEYAEIYDSETGQLIFQKKINIRKDWMMVPHYKAFVLKEQNKFFISYYYYGYQVYEVYNFTTKELLKKYEIPIWSYNFDVLFSINPEEKRLYFYGSPFSSKYGFLNYADDTSNVSWFDSDQDNYQYIPRSGYSSLKFKSHKKVKDAITSKEYNIVFDGSGFRDLEEVLQVRHNSFLVFINPFYNYTRTIVYDLKKDRPLIGLKGEDERSTVSINPKDNSIAVIKYTYELNEVGNAMFDAELIYMNTRTGTIEEPIKFKYEASYSQGRSFYHYKDLIFYANAGSFFFNSKKGLANGEPFEKVLNPCVYKFDNIKFIGNTFTCYRNGVFVKDILPESYKIIP